MTANISSQAMDKEQCVIPIIITLLMFFWIAPLCNGFVDVNRQDGEMRTVLAVKFSRRLKEQKKP
jgi:hypothetical protein